MELELIWLPQSWRSDLKVSCPQWVAAEGLCLVNLFTNDAVDKTKVSKIQTKNNKKRNKNPYVQSLQISYENNLQKNTPWHNNVITW